MGFSDGSMWASLICQNQRELFTSSVSPKPGVREMPPQEAAEAVSLKARCVMQGGACGGHCVSSRTGPESCYPPGSPSQIPVPGFSWVTAASGRPRPLEGLCWDPQRAHAPTPPPGGRSLPS